jgi:erythronate-4-phosphate dehydrogenase
MKIVVDKFIPYINGVFEPFAEVQYLAPADFTPEAVRHADALIVRTRTHCNAALLSGSQVRFIATATIGYDHIDADFCQKNGIKWTNAPGCNAPAVGRYVASVLCFWAKKYGIDLREKTLGIVGVGHVGREVLKMAKLLGMSVLQNDPIREKAEKSGEFVLLTRIAHEADIITFHTPLTHDGEFATYHMADAQFFADCRRKPLIINAARGGVVDENALKNALKSGQISDCAIDCWENEPRIDAELLQMAMIATPHIAGYSADGKAAATEMCVRAVSQFFGLGLDDFCVKDLPMIEPCHCRSYEERTQAILRSYDISCDDAALRSAPNDFEKLRSEYKLRRDAKFN